MLKSLGYKKKNSPMYYHFKIPNNNLDYGLQALGNDVDVMNLVRYIDNYRLIEVYIKHEYIVLKTYLKSAQKLRLEEIVDVESSALARKPFKKPGLKLNRLPQLVLGGPSSNDDVESDEEAVNEYETVSESDDSQDSDFIVDEDNLINEVDVRIFQESHEKSQKSDKNKHENGKSTQEPGASSVGGSHASSVGRLKASSVGGSKRARASQTGTSSAAKRSKAKGKVLVESFGNLCLCIWTSSVIL
ncbi:hypothetical protein Tco_0864311, partial [Tanacetum coccineum]